MANCTRDVYGTYRYEWYIGQAWCIKPYPQSFLNGPLVEGVTQSTPFTTIWEVYYDTVTKNAYYGISAIGDRSNYTMLPSTFYPSGSACTHISLAFDDVNSKIVAISWPNNTITINRATASITFNGSYGVLYNNIDIQPYSNLRDTSCYYLNSSTPNNIYGRFLRDSYGLPTISGVQAEFAMLQSSAISFSKLLYSYTGQDRQNTFGINSNGNGFLLYTRPNLDKFIYDGSIITITPVSGFYDSVVLYTSANENVLNLLTQITPVSGFYDSVVLYTSANENVLKLLTQITPVSGFYESIVLYTSANENVLKLLTQITPVSGLYDNVVIYSTILENLNTTFTIRPNGGAYV